MLISAYETVGPQDVVEKALQQIKEAKDGESVEHNTFVQEIFGSNQKKILDANVKCGCLEIKNKKFKKL